MKIVRLKLLLLVLTISSVSFSQNYELGKVTVEELQQTVHPTDSSASAAILFKKGDTKFTLNNSGWTITTEISFKIKVYKKEGISFADQQFAYYVGSSGRENMFFHDAYTYNLVDGKIEKTKLKNESEFKEEYNEEWNVKKITFPLVKEGSIIEFTVKKSSPFLSFLDDFYFQTEVPMNNVEYVIEIPEYFKYRTVLTGYEKIDVKTIPERSIYKGKNIPALKAEDYVINKDNYTAILKLELASIAYPGEPIKNVALDWQGVVKTIFDNDYFGGELGKTDYFKSDIDLLLKDVTSKEEKIIKIFSFVKSKMTWNEKFGIYTNDGVRKAYKQNQGNVAEINFMLIAMLNYAGIDTSPVLISTRSNGIATFPNRNAFNYVAAAVELQNNLLFLDATNNYHTPGMLPLRALNWVGRLVRKHGSSVEVNLLDVDFSKESVVVMSEIDLEGNLVGKARRQKTNYYAYAHRNNFANVKEDSYLERLEKSFNDMDIEEYKVDNLKNISLPITESFTFKDDNSVEIIGDKMYVSPFFFFSQSTNPFNSETRTYPVDFNFPFKDSYNFSIKIPEGYEVEFLPSPIQLGMIKDYGIFKFNVSNNGNQIQVVSNFDINTFKVSAEDYLILKEFYKVMLGKHAEKIILKKKS
jgi:hypothetical protein